MKFTTVVATLVSTAAAMDWLSVVPLHARQVTSGPKYECHEDCGYAILGAEQEGYCDNSTWTENFDGCMNCALEFDIWQYYSDGVTGAAEGCDLEATPVAAANETTEATTTAGSTADATSTATSTASEESASSTTEASGSGFNQPSAFMFAVTAVLAATQLL